MQVTFFLKPDGRRAVTEISNVYTDDAAWFEQHNVKVSMEDIGDQMALYADIGKVYEGEPDEVIVLTGSMNCQDALHKLRLECESEMQTK